MDIYIYIVDGIVQQITIQRLRYLFFVSLYVSLITLVFIIMLPVYVCDTYFEKYCNIMTSNCMTSNCIFINTHEALPDNNICTMNVKEDCLKVGCDRAHCTNTLVYKGLYTFWNFIFGILRTIAFGIFIVYTIKFIDECEKRIKLSRRAYSDR